MILSASSDDSSDIGANFGTSIPKYSNSWLISDLEINSINSYMMIVLESLLPRLCFSKFYNIIKCILLFDALLKALQFFQ